MSIDKIVYAAIGCGIAVIGTAVAYVVSYESRLSRLETQLGFVMGATSATNVAIRETSSGDPKDIVASTAAPIASAVADQCANLMADYATVVGANTFLTSGDKEKLEAIARLLEQMGCASRLNQE